MKVKGCLVFRVLRGLFEGRGAYNNARTGEVCAVYSRVRTKQGRELIKEIRMVFTITFIYFSG